MGELIPLIAIVSLFIVLPGMIFHYITEWKKTNSLSADDERLIEDLWKTAQKLEKRCDALETILDQEAPDWRKRDEEARRTHA